VIPDSPHVAVDVVVLGAGPAGTAAAIACLERGLRVHLVEQSPFPRSVPGETLHPGAVPVLEHLGVWRDLERLTTVRPAGHWVQWNARPRLNRYSGAPDDPWRGCQVMRSDLDMALLQRALTLGAGVWQPCRPRRVIVSDGRVSGLVTSHGVLTSRWVVDATGKAAWLARRLRLAVERHSPPLVSAYGYVAAPRRPYVPLPRLRADAGGWTWAARVSPTVDAWVRTSPADRRPPRGWVPSDLARRRVLTPARFVDVTWRVLMRPAGPGYFVAGDSAAVLDPARSSGVLNALVSGTLAGTCLASILTSGADERAACAAYTHYVHTSFSNDARALGALYSMFPWWPVAEPALGGYAWH
jgi:flavin-dependent dehydrogenase